jgi:hypothetical protein
MSSTDPETGSGSIPFAWIAIFLLVALGLGASAVLAVGGDLTPATAAF